MKIGLKGNGMDWHDMHVVDEDGNDIWGVRRVAYDIVAGDLPTLTVELVDTAPVEIKDVECGEIEWAGRRWREVVP